jgi:hypothetical protein
VELPICELEGHGYSGELEHGPDNALMTHVAQVRPLPPQHDAPPDDVGAIFINAITLPLQENLLQAPPRRRARRREPENFIPRRSDRLAAKSVFRDPNPEKQAKRVLVNKWEGRPDDAVTNTPDEGIALKFHAAFGGPVSPRKLEYMRMLFHGTRQYEPEELEY